MANDTPAAQGGDALTVDEFCRVTSALLAAVGEVLTDKVVEALSVPAPAGAAEPVARFELHGPVIPGMRKASPAFTWLLKPDALRQIPSGTLLYTHPQPTAQAAPTEAAALTELQIEAIFQAAGGRWQDKSYWAIEDADLHPFVRTLLAAARAPTGEQ